MLVLFNFGGDVGGDDRGIFMVVGSMVVEIFWFFK